MKYRAAIYVQYADEPEEWNWVAEAEGSDLARVKAEAHHYAKVYREDGRTKVEIMQVVEEWTLE